MDWKNNGLVRTVSFPLTVQILIFSILFPLITFRYGTEEDGWHGCNMAFGIFNEDGSPVHPEKTVVHKINIDSSCSISGYCNTANAVSLEVVSKDNEPVTVGDHFQGGEVSCHIIAYHLYTFGDHKTAQEVK